MPKMQAQVFALLLPIEGATEKMLHQFHKTQRNLSFFTNK
jgi:hypothetical protein